MSPVYCSIKNSSQEFIQDFFFIRTKTNRNAPEPKTQKHYFSLEKAEFYRQTNRLNDAVLNQRKFIFRWTFTECLSCVFIRMNK